MIYLDTPLAEPAFRLLLKLQEVTLDYNKEIDLNKWFDQADIKYIVEYDNKVEEIIISESGIQDLPGS